MDNLVSCDHPPFANHRRIRYVSHESCAQHSSFIQHAATEQLTRSLREYAWFGLSQFVCDYIMWSGLFLTTSELSVGHVTAGCVQTTKAINVLEVEVRMTDRSCGADGGSQRSVVGVVCISYSMVTAHNSKYGMRGV